jgi:hypothetical protein
LPANAGKIGGYRVVAAKGDAARRWLPAKPAINFRTGQLAEDAASGRGRNAIQFLFGRRLCTLTGNTCTNPHIVST